MHGMARRAPDVAATVWRAEHKVANGITARERMATADVVGCLRQHLGWLLAGYHQDQVLHIETAGTVLMYHRYLNQCGIPPSNEQIFSIVWLLCQYLPLTGQVLGHRGLVPTRLQ
jgi:hypothetical protein